MSDVRRTPSGDTPVEVIASAIRDLRGRADELERRLGALAYDRAGAAEAGVADHEGASDPHGQYARLDGAAFSGLVQVLEGIQPTSDETVNLGAVARRWRNAFMSGEFDQAKPSFTSVYQRFRGPDGGSTLLWADNTRDRLLIRSYDSSGVERARLTFDPTITNAVIVLQAMQAASTLLYRLDQNSNRHSFVGRVWLHGASSHLDVEGNLNVSGTKNAQIADPDNEQIAYRFAAVEFDNPGTLGTTIRDVAVDSTRRTVIPLPEHFARIGRDPTVFATYAAEPEGNSPHGPWASVRGWDDGQPEVVLRAPQGRYHLLLLFTRSDAGADGWEHVVDVPADDDLYQDAPDVDGAADG